MYAGAMLKNIALLVILLSVPVMLFTYGWGMLLLYKEAGLFVFIPACVAHIIGWIGIGSLLDSRQ